MYFIKLTSLYSTKYESIQIKNTQSSIKGGGAAFPKGKQISQFWHKVVPSLNGVDPSLYTQLLDPTSRAKCSNILHDMSTDFESLECF
jgi:hypothetical protein